MPSCLNPLKQVKSFGLIISNLFNESETFSLNPLKQVKSFGRNHNRKVIEADMESLNPLKQVKSFGPIKVLLTSQILMWS